MNLTHFCGICLESQGCFVDFVAFKSPLKKEDIKEDLSYLEIFELVTHLKIDINVVQELHLCPVCRSELENSFSFLRKAEKSQRLLYEKIELEQTRKQGDLNQDLDLNDLIEEIVSDDYSSEPVLTDAMLGTNSNDYSDAFSENERLQCDNDTDNVHLSPLSCHEDHLILPDVIISTDVYDDVSLHNETNYENYSCSLCTKTFNNHASLKTHLKYHKQKKAHVQSDACSICEKKFSSASYLRQHMELVHADERQRFKCDQCEKFYFTKNALRNHKRFHTGETINCLIANCHKSFATQYDLKVHMRFHNFDYPFVCTVCNKKFAIKGHLSSHMREHQGLKLQCENCGKLFTSTKALLDHSFVHSEEMPYPCKYCKKSYPSKQKYKEHLMSVHKIEFDELKHAAPTLKSLRRKNLTLVQANSVIKEIEIQDKSVIENYHETECCFDEVVLEVS